MPHGPGEQFYLATLSGGLGEAVGHGLISFHKHLEPIAITGNIGLTKSLFYTKSLRK